MGLMSGVPAPEIEAVIKRQTGFELLKVVANKSREAKRGGKEPRGLRSKVKTGGIGTTDNRGQMIEGS